MFIQIVSYMVNQAIVAPDGTGVFVGSPRRFMERHGASSGFLYKKLYDLGFERSGSGPKAKWTIPAVVMVRCRRHKA